MKKVNIGDPVEVRVLTPREELWLPATVIVVKDNGVIGVTGVYRDQRSRMMVESRNWRIPLDG